MSEPTLELHHQLRHAVEDTVQSILDIKGAYKFTISPEATVYQAIADMAKYEVGALMVVSGERLTGIVSERDYARKVFLRGKSSKATLVEEIMTTSPITVTPEHRVDECMRLMTAHRVRHLPVVAEERLLGMISIGDLVRAIISAQAHTIDRLHAYIGADYPG
jgi:CBS domain-containing protein